MKIYYCDDCGMSFRKTRKKGQEAKCPRCGSTNLWSEDIDHADFNEVDIASEKICNANWKI